MNEEEKKAIEFLKENMLDYEEIDTSILLYINLTHKTILNLIEKLQKENEELKEEKMPLTIVGGIRNKKILEYGISLGRMQVLQELIEEREEK